MRYFDAFKTQPPQLGLDGYTHGVPSLPGFLCTMVLTIMVITFFASQASNFGDGRNVLVTEVPNKVTSAEDSSDLNEMFNIAFSAHNYLDATEQYNSEVNPDLEWVGYLYTRELGIE